VADIASLIGQLSLDEKASLTAGADFWSTVAVERLGIPKVYVSDGPNGVRGPHFPGTGPPSVCLPCGTAIAATWNPGLVERAGALLGGQARDRDVRVLLAPTVNLHRSPLAGRNFECYSEDPYLAGSIAAAFVRGVQSRGVITTVKHFVGNEAEFERMTINSVIDQRTLRELYLVPFEMAVGDGGALGVMTSYNRLNGHWLTEQGNMLNELLRNEWGFDGLVVTDWFAMVDTIVSATSGLDLEMPGPARKWGPALADAARRGDVAEADVDRIVTRLLEAFDTVGILDDGPAISGPVALPDTNAERALAYEVAVESTVLLTNNGVLPLTSPASVALIGPNALLPRIMGGGSSQVVPHRIVSFVDALTPLVPSLMHHRGCELDEGSLVAGLPGLRTVDGFAIDYLDADGVVVEQRTLTDAAFFHLEPPIPSLAGVAWSARGSGRVTPSESGIYRLTLAQAGRARVWLDGRLVIDGVEHPPSKRGTAFFGLLSADLVADVELVEGQPVEIRFEFTTHQDEFAAGMRIGFHLPEHADLIQEAADAASAAEVAVVIVGTSEQSESEAADRTTLALPGRQDELIRRVVAANPNTVVVVNAGSVIDMPWADDVAAIVQCWFGGQEMATAVADILVGRAEPSGRLTTTFPTRLEHNPSFGNFPGENGEVRYGEGLFVGYRGYDSRGLPVRFPFGHGLGYTTFDIGEPTVTVDGFDVTLTVVATNSGTRRGSTVIQCYVAPLAPRLSRPPKELKGFAKLILNPGESADATIVLDRRAFSYWDPGQPDWDDVQARAGRVLGVGGASAAQRRTPGWYADPGRYHLLIAHSAGDILATVELDLPA